MARPAWKIQELIESNLESARKCKKVTARLRILDYVEYLRGELKLQQELEAGGMQRSGPILGGEYDFAWAKKEPVHTEWYCMACGMQNCKETGAHN